MFCTKTRFETETQGYSEMGYFQRRYTARPESNRPYVYFRCGTGSSLQLRLSQGVVFFLKKKSKWQSLFNGIRPPNGSPLQASSSPITENTNMAYSR